MKKALLYLLALIGWFVRHTVLIVFALMVFSLFSGALIYLGYSFGYEMGVMDAIEMFQQTQELKQYET